MRVARNSLYRSSNDSGSIRPTDLSGQIHGICDGSVLLEGKQGAEIMDKNHSVLQLCHTVYVLCPWNNGLGGNQIPVVTLDEAGCISRESNRTPRSARDDKLIDGNCVAPGQSKPLADIDHRNDPAVDVDHTGDDFRSRGKRSHAHHADDSFDGSERQRVTLTIEIKGKQ
jgi:hypothetical protein